MQFVTAFSGVCFPNEFSLLSSMVAEESLQGLAAEVYGWVNTSTILFCFSGFGVLLSYQLFCRNESNLLKGGSQLDNLTPLAAGARTKGCRLHLLTEIESSAKDANFLKLKSVFIFFLKNV